jgi:protein-tyrosine phosphatase
MTLKEFETNLRNEIPPENSIKKTKLTFFYLGKEIESFDILKDDDCVYIDDTKFHELFTMVSKFNLDEKKEFLDFPTTLTSSQRRFVHHLSSYFNLFTESKGKAKNRFIQISKKPFDKKKDNIPEGLSVILDSFLYLGSGKDALDKDQLNDHKIERILNLTAEWPLIQSTKFEVKRIPLKDVKEQNICDSFDEAFDFINKSKEKNQRVLVHCVIGKSRSV